MGEVVGSIQRVSDIVAEITSASVEQSSGVQKVGEAVSQMDQATQQNTALVQAVAVFRLSSEAPLGSVPVALAAANAPVAERRGPVRAKNVSRPPFRAEAATAVAAKTGTDDWSSF